jgi:hypothetical protein
MTIKEEMIEWNTESMYLDRLFITFNHLNTRQRLWRRVTFIARRWRCGNCAFLEDVLRRWWKGIFFECTDNKTIWYEIAHYINMSGKWHKHNI